jgi:subtilisin family serine protease
LEPAVGDEAVRVIVRMRDAQGKQAVLPARKSKAQQAVLRSRQSKTKGAASLRNLKRHVSERRDRILSQKNLQLAGNQDRVRSARTLWLANAFAVTLRPHEIPSLLEDPDVAEIVPNVILSIPEVESEPDGDSDSPPTFWNHDIINLDWVRSLGIDGTGVRIGHIDSGIDADHPDLRDKLIAWNEFDAEGDPVASTPHESHYMGHGTHVASVIVGDVAGIAPGARLISALGLPDGHGTTEQVLAAIQWVIDPDEDPDTDDGAQIVNMSWGVSGTSGVLQAAMDNLQASGIVVVAAIGNDGVGHTMSPGNTPGAIGVGATTAYDTIAGFSAGGEVCWENLCLLKPDLSAPGANIYGADPATGGFQRLSGTSMTAPHVSGAAALLIQYDETLTLPKLKSFLENSSEDLGSYGMDYRFGWGRLDLGSAFDFLDTYGARRDREDLIVSTTKSVAGQSVPICYVYFSGGDEVFQNGEFGYVPIWPAPDSVGTEMLGTGDADGDGFADLIVADTVQRADGSYSIHYDVYPARGAYGFSKIGSTWATLDTSDPENYRPVGIADLNGDSRSDLLIAREEGQVLHMHVLLSTGTGFDRSTGESWASIFTTANFRFDVGTGDVNGDGRSDLVYTKTYNSFMRYFPTYCYVLLSDGSEFQPQTRWQTIQPAYPYSAIEQFYFSDVNGDGFADLTFRDQVSNYSGNLVRLHVCLSNGANHFLSSKKWAEIDAGNMTTVETFSDVDGDYAADLVVSCFDTELNAKTIHVWLAEAQSERFNASLQAWFVPPSSLISGGFNVVDVANVGMGTWGAWSW